MIRQVKVTSQKSFTLLSQTISYVRFNKKTSITENYSYVVRRKDNYIKYITFHQYHASRFSEKKDFYDGL